MTISPRGRLSLPAVDRRDSAVSGELTVARAPRLEDVLPGRDHGEREADPEAGEGHHVPFSVTSTRPIEA